MGRPRKFRIKAYREFLEMMVERFGWSSYGIEKEKRLVWFKIRRNKRVYLDIRFKNFYENRYWGDERFMTYGVEWIKVVKIGKHKFGMDLKFYGVNIPKDGYIHQQSKLDEFLRILEYMSRIG